MLITNPYGNSMEWTGAIDELDYIAESPSECAAKYEEELAACAKLVNVQKSTCKHSTKFKSNIKIPVTLPDHTVVFILTETGGSNGRSLNVVASKLAEMDIYDDAIIATQDRETLNSLKDTKT